MGQIREFCALNHLSQSEQTNRLVRVSIAWLTTAHDARERSGKLQTNRDGWLLRRVDVWKRLPVLSNEEMIFYRILQSWAALAFHMTSLPVEPYSSE
jgi:hypothetical protein